jgi:predicted metal-dependent HD superfamily phosphohydrolase
MNACQNPDLRPRTSESEFEALRARFVDLWRRNLLEAAGDEAESVWRGLVAHYAEPHRHYHDSRHLAHCIRQFDRVADRLTEPDQVETALWFHDVIIEPGRSDNEQRSADYFRNAADAVLPPDFIRPVADLILFTTHRTTPADIDHRFICDIDLSSFGSPWDLFMANSVAIEAEFPGPRDEYVRREIRFLETLLRRPRIFLSDFFHDRCEERARDNIRRFLHLLGKPDAP